MNKVLKIIFPLSLLYKTPKKFFISLVAYLLIYLFGGAISVAYVGIVVSIYVFMGGFLLVLNYLKNEKNKKDRQ